jgi:hypothetical protein
MEAMSGDEMNSQVFGRGEMMQAGRYGCLAEPNPI